MSAQVVLITGALTGIGRATAVAFARKGAKIVVSGRARSVHRPARGKDRWITVDTIRVDGGSKL